MMTSTFAGGTICEMDVEAVREQERLARGQILFDLVLVDLRLDLVLGEDLNDVTLRRCLRGAHGGEPMLDRLVPVRSSRKVADDDVHAAVPEVLSLSVSLAAVTNDCDCLALQYIQICILIVVCLCHFHYPPVFSEWLMVHG